MTEKRFTAIPETVSYKDNLTGERLCPKREKDYYAVLNKMNELSDEKKELKEENEQLKSELSRYKEVNRLDIWKSSYSSEDALITELQMKCDKKQEHIVVLENKIRRMREAIHKLEWLATHRNGELKRENEQLNEENKKLKLEKQELEITLLNNQLAYNDLNKENVNLKGELDYWKKRALLLENKYGEGDSIKWLRENTVWEQIPTNITTKSNNSYETK